MPLGAMAQWAWHSFPNTGQYKLADTMTMYDSHGRQVPYPAGIAGLRTPGQTPPEHAAAAEKWLTENPQRIHLARVGLVLLQQASGGIAIDAISAINQTLDLWTGCVDSRFTLSGAPVRVETACHPQRNALAVRIESPLLADGELGLLLAFPYASAAWAAGYDWNSPGKYQTNVTRNDHGAVFESVLDDTRYWSSAQWSGRRAELRPHKPHPFHLVPAAHDSLEFAIEFSPEKLHAARLSAHQILTAARTHWPEFWQRGGAIDLSNCTDERAPELERPFASGDALVARCASMG